jgi:hypothetical protein
VDACGGRLSRPGKGRTASHTHRATPQASPLGLGFRDHRHYMNPPRQRQTAREPSQPAQIPPISPISTGGNSPASKIQRAASDRRGLKVKSTPLSIGRRHLAIYSPSFEEQVKRRNSASLNPDGLPHRVCLAFVRRQRSGFTISVAGLRAHDFFRINSDPRKSAKEREAAAATHTSAMSGEPSPARWPMWAPVGLRYLKHIRDSSSCLQQSPKRTGPGQDSALHAWMPHGRATPAERREDRRAWANPLEYW